MSATLHELLRRPDQPADSESASRDPSSLVDLTFNEAENEQAQCGKLLERSLNGYFFDAVCGHVAHKGVQP